MWMLPRDTETKETARLLQKGVFSTKAQGEESPMTKAERIAVCESFLAAEGYRPSKDNEGDLLFKSEGALFAILLDSEDETFYRVVFPNFWAVENEAQQHPALSAAHLAVSNTKVAKVFFVENHAWASVELFCTSPQEFTAVLERSIGAIKTAVQSFVDTMRTA